MAKRALLLINRQARRGRDLFAQSVDHLNRAGFEILTLPMENRQDASSYILQERDLLDLVVVGGGDGTLNTIVDALVEARLPLGILPLGTANDLARTLGIPNSLPEACRTIAEGHLQSIDLGLVNGKFYFNVASVGLSVTITQQLSRALKRRLGALAYAWTALKVLSRTRSFPATIWVDGVSLSVNTIQIAVGNGRYYGGGMSVAHDAAIDDERLDLYSLEIQHGWQIIPLLWRLPKGRQGLLPWVRTLQGREIRLDTPRPHLINTDGEITGSTPATFRVVPRALEVYAPRPAAIPDGFSTPHGQPPPLIEP